MLKTFKMEKLIASTTTSQKQLRKVKSEKAALISKGREEIAEHMQKNELPRAKNKVMNLIQEANRLETMDILEFYCNTLHQHAGLIKSAKKLDPTLVEAVSTVIWAAPRLLTEVPELMAVSDQLFYKYGREYGQTCRANKNETVNREVFQKLSVGIPTQSQMVDYLTDICTDFDLKKVTLVMDEGMYDLDGIYAQRINQIKVNTGPSLTPNVDMAYSSTSIPLPADPNLAMIYQRSKLPPLPSGSFGSESGSACTASSDYEETFYYE